MGKVENKGFEIQFRSDLLSTADWYVAVFANLAHNTNKIKKISDALKAYNDAVNEYYNQEIESLGQGQSKFEPGDDEIRGRAIPFREVRVEILRDRPCKRAGTLRVPGWDGELRLDSHRDAKYRG